MTDIEALEIISVASLKRQIGPDLSDVIMNALEKQIPKKPHKKFEKFSGVWCSCGKYLGKGYFIDKPCYCRDCGQKLDWSDEE